MTDHLVIGDPHAMPGQSNRRFTWLGRLIADRKPDVVINLGDMADMASLCSYESGLAFENKRYKKDITSVIMAQSAIWAPIWKLNKQLSLKHKPKYTPRMVMLGGNHDEGRINRYINDNPILQDTMSLNDCQYKEFGWEYVPYLTPIKIDGINYCHEFPSGVQGRAITGDHIAHSLLGKNHESSTMGHIHIFDHKCSVLSERTRIWGLVAGCYVDPTYKPKWAKGGDKYWWSGICYCHGVKDGDYDLEKISIDRMERMYGR